MSSGLQTADVVNNMPSLPSASYRLPTLPGSSRELSGRLHRALAVVTPRPIYRISGMEVKSRRAAHSADTRRALVCCARGFCERGYTATSLDAVRQRARVTRCAFYDHFRDKGEEAFVAALEQVE